MPCVSAGCDGIVVLLLIAIYHILDWQMFKQRVQFTQDQRLPQAPHTTIAINKGMDKLKFKMEDARTDKQMVIRMFQPIK